jgi:putative DeoR family transcriptional regulator (stage III sporulation protein D)
MLHSGLYEQVRRILEKNKEERHIRGGLATKRKYEREKRAGVRKE